MGWGEKHVPNPEPNQNKQHHKKQGRTHAMLLRSVQFDPRGEIEATTGMIHRKGMRHDIEEGIYLNRDDLVDLLRQMASGGYKGLPDLATAVPGYIAEKIRLLP